MNAVSGDSCTERMIVARIQRDDVAASARPAITRFNPEPRRPGSRSVSEGARPYHVLMPPTSSSLPTVKVSPRGTTRLKSGHVWVYRSDIVSADGVAPGSVVRVTDHRGKPLGTALYSSSSQIAIRMISNEPVTDFPALLRQRIGEAIAYRERWCVTPTLIASSSAKRIFCRG